MNTPTPELESYIQPHQVDDSHLGRFRQFVGSRTARVLLAGTLGVGIGAAVEGSLTFSAPEAHMVTLGDAPVDQDDTGSLVSITATSENEASAHESRPYTDGRAWFECLTDGSLGVVAENVGPHDEEFEVDDAVGNRIGEPVTLHSGDTLKDKPLRLGNLIIAGKKYKLVFNKDLTQTPANGENDKKAHFSEDTALKCDQPKETVPPHDALPPVSSIPVNTPETPAAPAPPADTVPRKPAPTYPPSGELSKTLDYVILPPPSRIVSSARL